MSINYYFFDSIYFAALTGQTADREIVPKPTLAYILIR